MDLPLEIDWAETYIAGNYGNTRDNDTKDRINKLIKYCQYLKETNQTLQEALDNKLNNTNVVIGDANGNITFESNGFPVLNGTATYWKDIDFPIIIRTTGANIPTLTTLQGNITVPQWEVNDFNICEGQEFIHEWKEGSRVYWHIHLETNGLEAVAKYVKFEVEYFWIQHNGVISPTYIDTNEITIPANTPSKNMISASISNFIPTSGIIGSHVFARLRRITSTGAAPVASPWCSMLQLHVECDTLGSREIGTK